MTENRKSGIKAVLSGAAGTVIIAGTTLIAAIKETALGALPAMDTALLVGGTFFGFSLLVLSSKHLADIGNKQRTKG